MHVVKREVRYLMRTSAGVEGEARADGGSIGGRSLRPGE